METMELFKTVYEVNQLELIEAPQIPVAGRSNVGKSSFINCLAGQKKLAKISSKPGKTRSINFYYFRKAKGYIVDLPGYGYAQTSKKEREKWAKLVDVYFKQNSEYIKKVILLIDSRIPPQETDINLYNYLKDKGLSIIPVLTKVDKAEQSQRSKNLNFWTQYSEKDFPPLFFSAKTNYGKGKILELIYLLFKKNN